MKLLNIDWQQFLASLRLYETLSPEARRVFLEQIRPSQPASRQSLGSWTAPLVESGLVAVSQTGVNVSTKPEHREFSRAMRAMSRTRLFDTPSRESLLAYLNENLTASETASLGGSFLYGRIAFDDLERVFSLVVSPSWTKQFVNAEDPNWERDYADPAQPRYFAMPKVLQAAQTLVSAVAAAEGRIFLRDLPEIAREIHPDLLSGALRGVLRYLLLFVGLSSGSLEPVLGFWPGVADRLRSKPPEPPQPVEMAQPFGSAYLVGDMIAILAACQAEPLRLRSGDMRIFEADRKALADRLGSLPDWVERIFRLDAEQRISRALEFLTHYGLVDRDGKPGKELRMIATAEGAEWLDKSSKDRLLYLLDGIRPRHEALPFGFSGPTLSLVPGMSFGSTSDNGAVEPAILEAFAGLLPDTPFRLIDFIEYYSRVRNPIASLVRKDRYFAMQVGGSWINRPSEEDLEHAAEDLFSGFIATRLLPLGGARVGIEKDGNNLCFALTAAGQYLIGRGETFDLPPEPDARILIQPNFEVVFLSPSPDVEARLARFCERLGRNVGTLFRITKNAVMTAAASGLTLTDVLQSLEQYSPGGVPANVSSEISGWFRRFREVEVRPATLVQCPDQETAAVVLSALGKKVRQVTPTLLEIEEKKIPTALTKKLRDAGIFLRIRS